MNAFEAGTRKVVPAVLVYLKHGTRVLMIHRNAGNRVGDYHSGKWNGLGGKCEPAESFSETASREIREEAGIDLPESVFKALGFIHFPDFKAQKSEDWMVWIYTVRLSDEQATQVLRENPEGQLHWVEESQLQGLNLWAGDRHFIPFVRDEKKFTGTIWYQGPEVLRHSILPWSS
ncbi:MAG: 8-oxo-dGTP diphosphatase [Methylotenera sp.]|nr:8-oxo-dGTP diphosphatase [Oligoflexia bacterium]